MLRIRDVYIDVQENTYANRNKTKPVSANCRPKQKISLILNRLSIHYRMAKSYCHAIVPLMSQQDLKFVKTFVVQYIPYVLIKWLQCSFTHFVRPFHLACVIFAIFELVVMHSKRFYRSLLYDKMFANKMQLPRYISMQTEKSNVYILGPGFSYLLHLYFTTSFFSMSKTVFFLKIFILENYCWKY